MMEWETERERETGIQRETETESQIERQRQRQRDKDRDRETETKIERYLTYWTSPTGQRNTLHSEDKPTISKHDYNCSVYRNGRIFLKSVITEV